MRTLATVGFALFSTLVISSTGSSISYANPSFLSAEQAFQFSSESLSKQSVQLKWKIAPHYYLYHDQFIVHSQHQKLALKLPQGQQKQDPTFGLTEVHYDQVTAEFKVHPNTEYQIQWQGCSKDGLCYPVQRQTLTTDAEGLIPQSPSLRSNHSLKSLVDLKRKDSLTSDMLELTTKLQEKHNKLSDISNKLSNDRNNLKNLIRNIDRYNLTIAKKFF